jgi:neural Wiskott-Aldrich syndrome protein
MPSLPSSPHETCGPAPTTLTKSATPSKTPPKGGPLLAVSTPTRQLPTLTELLASAKKSKTHRRKSIQVASTSKDNGQDTAKRQPREFSSSSTRHVRATDTSCSNRDVSGNGEPEFTLNPGAFAPDFVSSQISPELNGVYMGGMSLPPGRGSSAMFGIGYDSQFDLEGQVDRVSELLERDVDFDVWLKDTAEVTESVFEDNKGGEYLSP